MRCSREQMYPSGISSAARVFSTVFVSGSEAVSAQSTAQFDGSLYALLMCRAAVFLDEAEGRLVLHRSTSGVPIPRASPPAIS